MGDVLMKVTAGSIPHDEAPVFLIDSREAFDGLSMYNDPLITQTADLIYNPL